MRSALKDPPEPPTGPTIADSSFFYLRLSAFIIA
jgi:hypothetical protein